MQRDLGEARRIILDALGDRRARVYLFGSWARNDQRRYSDIDVAIAPDEPLPPGFFLDLEERLDRSEILYPVDLVDLSTAAAALRERVFSEGVEWTA
jgi:predicted nucleotidyltransferase